MSPDKEKYLFEKYPKIFSSNTKSIQESCMAWGIEVGDGWFNILDGLCMLIQNHVDWSRKQRCNALRLNRALSKALNHNDDSALIKYVTKGRPLNDFDRQHIENLKLEGYCKVPEACPPVIAEQVKEKFGTLRFYYSGGDDYVYGVVSMADYMTSVTCEECGAPGKLSSKGWIKARCKKHQ